MMTFAKKIELFLMDGLANGRWACELSNWSGKAYKIPRTRLMESKDRSDLVSTGIYFLFGQGDDVSDKNKIYIGEAENLFERLKQHIAGKDFWHEVIVFFSKDESLNKAKIKYLESKLYDLAQMTARYDVLNKTSPTQSRVSEADKAELEEFLFNVKLLTNTLGHKVFEPMRDEELESSNDNVLFINAARGADAKGQYVPDGFLVFAGSKVAKEVAPAFLKHNYSKLRKRLIDEGVLVEGDGIYVVKNDYVFNTPSAAAAIIMGRSANGLTEWKTSAGKSLKQLVQS